MALLYLYLLNCTRRYLKPLYLEAEDTQLCFCAIQKHSDAVSIFSWVSMDVV